MNAQEILQQCTIEGNVVRLPDITLDRKQYLEVANKLNLIGGKWKGGKVKGFVFEQDPTDLLNDIANGENRNLKKEFQFFETPKELTEILCSYLPNRNIENILEPSAGRGAIVRAVNNHLPNVPVYYFELMDLNINMFNGNAKFLGNDFLMYRNTIAYRSGQARQKFDVIIANPPFSKNQDIEHFMEMYELCYSGGRIISIMSQHWQFSSNNKETKFREFLANNNARIIDIVSGAFKESGTMVSSCIVVLDKE